MFNKHTEYERGIAQGKAQVLYAIINLPDELRQLKSIEELQEHREKLERELREEEIM